MEPTQTEQDYIGLLRELSKKPDAVKHYALERIEAEMRPDLERRGASEEQIQEINICIRAIVFDSIDARMERKRIRDRVDELWRKMRYGW